MILCALLFVRGSNPGHSGSDLDFKVRGEQRSPSHGPDRTAVFFSRPVRFQRPWVSDHLLLSADLLKASFRNGI
jgi:hypothetical protein